MEWQIIAHYTNVLTNCARSIIAPQVITWHAIYLAKIRFTAAETTNQMKLEVKVILNLIKRENCESKLFG